MQYEVEAVSSHRCDSGGRGQLTSWRQKSVHPVSTCGRLSQQQNYCSSRESVTVHPPHMSSLPSPPPCLSQQRQLTLSTSLDLQTNLKSILNELNQFRRNTTSLNELSKLRQLSLLLLSEPQAASEVWKVGAVPRIVELSQCGREQVEQQARVALSLLGQPPQYSGRGLSILAVDGGGTR